jgi:hypothetical protein
MTDGILPEVSFGTVGQHLVDWRVKRDFLYDIDDDRELYFTPYDVVDVLGFDPKELREEETKDEFRESEHPRGQPENKGEFVSGGGIHGPGQAPQSQAGEGQVALFSPQEMALPKNAHQPVSTEQELYVKSGEALKYLQEWLDRGKGIATQMGIQTMPAPPEHTDMSQPGGMLFIAPLKGRDRARQKVGVDYGGDWTKLTDVTRCSIALDTMDQVKGVIDKLKTSGMRLACSPKDRFAKPTEAGYRDVLLKVKFPNGVVGEVQVHLKSMLQAKSVAHGYYEELRNLEGKPVEKWNVKDHQTWDRNMAASIAQYSKAWSAAHPGADAMPMFPSLHVDYEYYDYDNALYRRRGALGPITEVYHEGDQMWVPYRGDGVAPIMFGDKVSGGDVPE